MSNNKKKGFYNSNHGFQKKLVMNIQIIDKNNVLISGPFSIFTDGLKQIIKTCQGHFIKDDGGWIVPRSFLETIQTYITNEKLEIPINKIPGFVDKIFLPFNGKLNYKTKSETVKIEYDINDKLKQVSSLPETFTQKLYAFQKKGVEFGIKNFGRVLIADEMGVGKTIQALALASVYRTEWPFIVIAPSSLRLTWRDEIFKWIEDVRANEIQVITKSSVDIKSNIKALIISYDLASKMCDTIEDYKFQMAIVDEAHYLKNAEAKRTENLLPILKKCKRCIMLTGTPAFARPKELFNTLNILRPDVFTTFKDFGNRYCEPRPNKFSGGLDYNGAVNVKELHYILMNSVMIRRLKKDVLAELPPKRRQKVEVKTEAQYVKKIQDAISRSKGTGQMSSMVDSMMDSYFQADEQNFESEFGRHQAEEKSKHPEVLQCYLYTGLAKLGGIREYLHDLMQNDIKLLVFAHHNEVLNGIEEEVKKLKIRYMRIDGSVELNKRYENVKMFQEDPEVKIGILSLTAAGIGLTLTAASTCVFAEMYWTPAIMLQAEDRIHRMGQKNKTCVNYHYLYGEGTLDSLLYEKLQTKLAIVSEILEGKTEYLEVEEETKEPKEESNTQPTSGRRRKDAYGKEKTTSSASTGEKPIKGMAQITSYFQKKPVQTPASRASEPLTATADSLTGFGDSGTKPKSIMDMDLDRVDSLDWDDVDRLLQEDQAKNPVQAVNSETNQNSKTQRESIASFNGERSEDSRALEEMKEFKRYDEVKKKSAQEQEQFGKSVFYKCLDEIFENEKGALKEKDTNNKDIRNFFANEAKNKPEEKKERNPLENGSFFVWKKKDEKEEQARQNNEASGREGNNTPNQKTPIKVNSGNGSVAKGNNLSNTKANKFRFSLQPVSQIKESETSSDEGGRKGERKRTREVVSLSESDESEKELVSHVLKKIKENED